MGFICFLDALQQEITTGEYPEYIKKMKSLKFMDKLDENCYYKLDRHINAKGNRIVADEILRLMEL